MVDIVYSKKLNIENIERGMLIPDSTHNSKLWYIDEELIEQMREYENTTSKSAIKNNKITGIFLEFKWNKDNPKKSILK